LLSLIWQVTSPTNQSINQSHNQSIDKLTSMSDPSGSSSSSSGAPPTSVGAVVSGSMPPIPPTVAAPMSPGSAAALASTSSTHHHHVRYGSGEMLRHDSGPSPFLVFGTELNDSTDDGTTSEAGTIFSNSSTNIASLATPSNRPSRNRPLVLDDEFDEASLNEAKSEELPPQPIPIATPLRVIQRSQSQSVHGHGFQPISTASHHGARSPSPPPLPLTRSTSNQTLTPMRPTSSVVASRDGTAPNTGGNLVRSSSRSGSIGHAHGFHITVLPANVYVQQRQGSILSRAMGN
jgi:hypothetical protein